MRPGIATDAGAMGMGTFGNTGDCGAATGRLHTETMIEVDECCYVAGCGQTPAVFVRRLKSGEQRNYCAEHWRDAIIDVPGVWIVNKCKS